MAGRNIILIAARHNKREIHRELDGHGPIRPALSHLNKVLHGPATAEQVAQEAKDLMLRAGLEKLGRYDAVQGLELVCSLPIGSSIDVDNYFGAVLSWAADRFGGMANILSVDIHRDEGAPHCHVLILPLVGGRMNGSAMMGYKTKLSEMRQSFHVNVAAKFGLALPRKLNASDKRALAGAVIETLKIQHDPVPASPLWSSIRQLLEASPRRFVAVLGIELEAPAAVKPKRSMADIFTSRGRTTSEDRESRA